MRMLRQFLLFTFLTCSSLSVLASDLLMVRTQQGFPEAMLALQTSVRINIELCLLVSRRKYSI
jgi:hypothetical protein